MSLLQCIKNLLTIKKDVGKNGCPACDSLTVICTSYEHFNDNFSGPFVALKKLKTGHLLQCKSCETIWFIGDSKELVDTVSQDKLQIVEEWNSKKLYIQPEHLKVLLEIGCTPSDYYGNLKEFISIPCRCVLVSGKILENAVVSIQRKPPTGLLYYGKDDFYFIDKVKTIQPSEMALPLKVRIATSQAHEIRMGWAPTVLRSLEDDLYITNGTTNFFFENGIKGKDILISFEQESQSAQGTYTKNRIKEVRIIADWTPELEGLFNS